MITNKDCFALNTTSQTSLASQRTQLIYTPTIDISQDVLYSVTVIVGKTPGMIVT